MLCASVATCAVFILRTGTCVGQQYFTEYDEFPRQQWRHERATVLRYTYVAYIVVYV